MRAVKTDNPNIVVAAAAELPTLSLADALLVLLVFARARAPQTEAAAVRWAARYVAEVRPAPDAREAHLVLSAASALAGPCPAAGREALHALATRRHLVDSRFSGLVRHRLIAVSVARSGALRIGRGGLVFWCGRA